MPAAVCSRRRLVTSLGAVASVIACARLATAASPAPVAAPSPATPLPPTARQPAGPFYPATKPDDADADLVRVAGGGGEAAGTIIIVSGRLLAADGRPVADAVVEIWQCDAFGRYHHPYDGGGGDPRFQGYGATRSGADGGYRFRTIRPVAYPGRAPHIHFAISGAGLAPLTTQMYVAGEPLNDRDLLLNRIADPERRRALIVPLVAAPAGVPASLAGRFDIILG